MTEEGQSLDESAQSGEERVEIVYKGLPSEQRIVVDRSMVDFISEYFQRVMEFRRLSGKGEGEPIVINGGTCVDVSTIWEIVSLGRRPTLARGNLPSTSPDN